MVSRSASTVLFSCSDAGIIKRGWSKGSSLRLLTAAAHGTNCTEDAVTRGTETLRRAGQRPTPVAMPVSETLQGILYTDSGEVIKIPEDRGRAVVVVAKYARPPRCRSGCRLVQSLAITWCHGKVSFTSKLKGKPSQEILLATVNTLVGQIKAVESW